MYTEKIFSTFIALRSIRKISSFISAALALLLFAGNSGYTFIFHNCNECSVQEARHSIEVASYGTCHLCDDLFTGNQGQDENNTTMRHHCRHEIDRLETSELVKTDLQFDVAPFLKVIGELFLPPQETDIKIACSRTISFRASGRDLAKLHCQMLS
mgnify:CR=1 FL=1